MDNNPNWLVFSLSNPISLFQSSGVVADQENGSGSASSEAAASSDHHHHHHHQLSVLQGPKLEDFLGGASTADAVVAAQFGAAAGPHHHMSHHHVHDMYDDSELKTIAAGFLRGFSTDHQQTTTQKQLAAVAPPPQPPAKKSAETFGQRTSIFRGVTRHRWTGRYEAHLWDNSCRREGQSRKGRQVYLGGYDKEDKAARAYDLAALKYWGPTTTTNFPVSDYGREMEEMKHMTRQEFVASLRRKSSGFSRGASIYRGVTRHHQHGRWQARIGRVAGNKDLYLGTFSTQEEAAEAYDIAAIKFRGLNAVTNFDMSRYDVRSIASSNLPIGGATNKPKTPSESVPENRPGRDVGPPPQEDVQSFSSQNSAASINFGVPMKQDQSSSLWAALGYSQTPSTTTATTTNSTMFQECKTDGTTSFSMDNDRNGNNNEGLFNGYYHHQQQQQHEGSGTSDRGHHQNSSDCTIRDEAAVVFGNGGDWMKNNLTAFQTPLIFGIE